MKYCAHLYSSLLRCDFDCVYVVCCCYGEDDILLLLAVSHCAEDDDDAVYRHIVFTYETDQLQEVTSVGLRIICQVRSVLP